MEICCQEAEKESKIVGANGCRAWFIGNGSREGLSRRTAFTRRLIGNGPLYNDFVSRNQCGRRNDFITQLLQERACVVCKTSV